VLESILPSQGQSLFDIQIDSSSPLENPGHMGIAHVIHLSVAVIVGYPGPSDEIETSLVPLDRFEKEVEVGSHKIEILIVFDGIVRKIPFCLQFQKFVEGKSRSWENGNQRKVGVIPSLDASKK
jgi:hypothetical protein